ncbi:LuxR C-terminal-related transcriptional regulator [Streptosporangium sp. NPDC002721]|uniref:helix-turn-helix transcriptional regulator n=1 Tax=Streptosporangium sp. NPDC002721 TaxID=3366188 RepID=UPI0036793E09
MAESRYREVLVVLSDDPLGRFLSDQVGELPVDGNCSVSVVRAGSGEDAEFSAFSAPSLDGSRHLLHARTRTLPSVPLSVMITDRRAALLSLRPAPGETAPVVLVRRAGHVATLLAVFDHLWSAAHLPPPPEAGARQRRGAVLSLLAEGLTDGGVAARLGVAERTVRREVNGLMRSAGATSRFQLALRAQELGWLNRPAGETTPDDQSAFHGRAVSHKHG